MVLEYKYHWITAILKGVGLERFESGSGDVDMAPMGAEEASRLSPGAAMSLSTEKLLSEFIPVPSDAEAGAAWSKIPSQT